MLRTSMFFTDGSILLLILTIAAAATRTLGISHGSRGTTACFVSTFPHGSACCSSAEVPNNHTKRLKRV